MTRGQALAGTDQGIVDLSRSLGLTITMEVNLRAAENPSDTIKPISCKAPSARLSAPPASTMSDTIWPFASDGRADLAPAPRC